MHKKMFPSFAQLVKGVSIFVFVTLTLALSVHAQTQITTGTIQGTVADANGAIVPGASVEIKNLETNFSRTLTTDDGGRFVALALPPGNYSVTVSKQGFATTVVERMELTVGQAITLPVSMKVSGVEERVTISAPTLDTVKTESSTTLNQTTVTNTPVLGRKFEDLLTLTPGVSIVQGPDGDEITFNGQRGVFNNISLDGGDYNNGFFGEQLGGQRAAIDIPLEAIKEFQVVASSAAAEFGRTAGGVVNAVTDSGTNNVHGNVFYFQRHRALSANTSDGKPLKGFHREQFGGKIGGPIQQNKAFYFFTVEQIRENLTRDNLSTQLGPTPCPVSAPTIIANEALINSNQDCQRLALITFIKGKLSQDEGLPVRRPVKNTAFLAKFDWNLSDANKLAVSYNFDYSKNENQTFDVATYGTSANGTEGPSKINNINLNLFTTVSPTRINEAHFSYTRELRPRSATKSNLPADTGTGFGPTFRFGNPFFLQPNVDETLWRTHVKDNFAIVNGNHTIKVGGEWLHTLNSQVFRGFFTGRYLFDTVAGFLRYASPAAPGGFGPQTVACSNGTFVTLPTACPGGSTPTGGPLLFFLQDGIPGSVSGLPPPGASSIKNEDYALFAQDKWQVRPNFTLNYGLRWEAQIFPKPIIDPSKTAYGSLLSDPRFPSDGTLHNQTKEWQPRVGIAWDISKKGKSVLRASYGIFYGRQNMLTQVGSITTNGAQQRTNFVSTDNIRNFGSIAPVWPLLPPAPAQPPGTFPLFTGVRVFSRDYENPRINTTNISFEQEVARDWAVYVDFTHSKGIHLTRFVDINNGGAPAICCAISNTVQIHTGTTGDSVFYSGPAPFGPALGNVFVASSSAKSLYRGLTIGARKRLSRGYQMEFNYVWSKDKDNDSNERDPFTDRAFNRFDFSKDYSFSDRDIRHKFNFFTYAELPWKLHLDTRIQARSAQPITPSPRVLNGVDRGRNSLRKDTKYFSFDWRVTRPFNITETVQIIPIIEMFNTFNSKNNINPLTTPALFDFSGFLRFGVGDPRQLQVAVKLVF
jgi:hypothetical protein